MRIEIPEKRNFIEFPDDMNPDEIRKAINDNWDSIPMGEDQSGYSKAFSEGFKGSNIGNVLGARANEQYQPQSFLEGTAQAAGALTGDLPSMAVGGMIGGGIGLMGGPIAPITVPVGAAMGAFGLPAAIRGAYNAKDAISGMWDTTKAMLTGAATAGTGLATKALQIPGLLGKAAPLATELTAMESAGAGLEGRPLSAESFAQNALLLGAMKAVTPAWKAGKKMFEEPPSGGGGGGGGGNAKSVFEKTFGVKLEDPTSKTVKGEPELKAPEKTLAEMINERYGGQPKSAAESARAIEEGLWQKERERAIEKLTAKTGKSAEEAAAILNDPAARAKYEIAKIIEEERPRILGPELDTLRKGAVKNTNTLEEVIALSEALKKTTEAKRSALGIKEYGDIPIIGEEKTTGRPIVLLNDGMGGKRIVPVEGGTIRQIIHLERSGGPDYQERLAGAMERQARKEILSSEDMLLLRKQYTPPEITGDKIGPVIQVRDAERAEFKQKLAEDATFVNAVTNKLDPPQPPPPSGSSSPVGGAGPAPLKNNASGESAASLEALARLKAQKESNQIVYRVDTRSLKATPIPFVDAVDAVPGNFELIVQPGIGKGGGLVILSEGKDVAGKTSEGVKNRILAKITGMVPEKTEPPKAKPGTWIAWIRDKGGVNDPDYSQEFSTKETGVIGLWNRAGKGMDILYGEAMSEQAIPAGVSYNQFVEMLKQDIRAAKRGGKRESLKLEGQDTITGEPDFFSPINDKMAATLGLSKEQRATLNKLLKEDPENFERILKGNTAELLRTYEMKRKGKAEKMTQGTLLDKEGTLSEGGVDLFAFPGGLGRAIKKGIIDPILNLNVGEEANLNDFFVRKVQDRFVQLKRIEDYVAERYGKQPDNLSAYQAETLMSSKVRRMLDIFEDTLYAPLVDKMIAARKQGVTLKDLDAYNKAKHAPGYNAKVKDRNEKFLTGQLTEFMTNAEAARIMAEFQNNGKAPVLEQLNKDIRNINRIDLELKLKYGLITQEIYDGLKTDPRWQNYVPFFGGEGKPEQMGTGKGLSVRKGMTAITGRTTDPGNTILNSLAQLERTLVTGEKNQVGNAFLNFTREGLANGWFTPDEVAINKVSSKPRYNPRTGKVEYESVPDFMGKEGKVFSTIENGKHFYITIENNPLLIRALNGLGADTGGKLLQTASMFNRYLAMVKTSLNLEFAATNPIRDAMTATLNVTGEHGTQLARQILKDVPKAMVGAYRGFKFELGTEWSRHADEYRAAGGAVGFYSMKDLEMRGRLIEREIARAEGKAGAVFMGAARDALSYVGDITAAGENAMRLSAFVNARKAGFSTEQAAIFSKNLTVNFNRHGEWGPLMNAGWLFFNANIQGTARIIQAAKANPQAFSWLALGGFTAGLMISEANRAVMGDDKDGISLYDKIDVQTRNKNLIIPLPFSEKKDKYAKIPLPYGYNIFHAMGQTVDQIANDPRRRIGAASLDLLGAFSDAFNPIGNTSNVVSMISPTMLDPAVEVAMNKDWAGRPIVPEQPQFGAPKPNSERYWESVTGASKAVARGLNSITGGNRAKAGAVDLSPEWIDYFTSFFLGGAGDIFRRSADVIQRAFSGQPIALKDVPLLRRFAGEKNEFYDAGRFRENVKDAQADKAEAKMYGGKVTGAENLAGFEGVGLSLQRDFSKIRHSLDLAEQKGDPKLEEKKRKVKEFENEAKLRFNKKVEDYLRKKREPSTEPASPQY